MRSCMPRRRSLHLPEKKKKNVVCLSQTRPDNKMADFLVSIVIARRMRSCMPRCRSLHLGKRTKKCRLSFSNDAFKRLKSREQNGGFSCEYCNCQAHAQLYAAPQVPPPAGGIEKKCRLSFSNKTRQQNCGFLVTARRMRSRMPRRRSLHLPEKRK